MRNYILQNYTTITKQTLVLGRHGTSHLRLFLIAVAALILLWLLHTLARNLMPSLTLLQDIVARGGLVLYGYVLIQFLNTYLDALIIKPDGITIFERNGILRYKVQQINRETIESITQSQNTLSDRILGKGTIQITIDHGAMLNFYDIRSPQRVAQELRNYKQQYGTKHPPLGEFDQHDGSNEKFEILVETLSEVIKDYMGRQSEHNQALPHKKWEM